jgi:aryl-alcohol dehydrogenase-like predicted oxidoreductase
MEFGQLGLRGPRVSRIAFGNWSSGGDWGSVDRKVALAVTRQALDLGITFFDTARAYGFGSAEEVLGEALRPELRSRREDVVIATKGGLRRAADGQLGRDSSAGALRRDLESSLRHLGTDYVDLYQIHWPDPGPDIEEGWATFAELKEEGLVRHIGVSNFDVAQLRRIQAIAPVETLQPPYSLVERGVEGEILPFAEREGIGVIVYSPMGSGLLTGAMTRERIEQLPDDDWRKRSARFQEPQLSEHLALVDRLRTVADRHDTSPGAIAVAWTMLNPAVDGAITGFRRPDQVDPIITAAQLELSDEDVATIEGRA